MRVILAMVIVLGLLPTAHAADAGEHVISPDRRFAVDTTVYEFTPLPQAIAGSGSAALLGGYFFGLSNYEVGADLLRIEMFENGLAEVPICSALLDTEPAIDSCSATGAWADFQGVARLTMSSGSATLEDVTFYHQQPTGSDSWTRMS